MTKRFQWATSFNEETVPIGRKDIEDIKQVISRTFSASKI
jgi:hypothetical protein